jgi:hypothetical protein
VSSKTKIFYKNKILFKNKINFEILLPIVKKLKKNKFKDVVSSILQNINSIIILRKKELNHLLK